jgi:hypothetical protein
MGKEGGGNEEVAPHPRTRATMARRGFSRRVGTGRIPVTTLLARKTAANRLRFNAEKLMLLSHELETFRSDSNYTRRIEHLRIAIANTLADLKEVSDSLGGEAT